MCKVSVLIPAYNVEAYVRECIDSVLNQSLSDFEIICVDDASTDNTLSILREYEVMDSRIKVLCHDENKGQSCGRNYALSHATGEYVYMLDADDKIIPEALQELYDICVKDHLDVVGFETKQFAQDERFEKAAAIKTIRYDDCSVMNGREGFVYCMEQEVFSLSVPTFMIRREYLEQIDLHFVEGILHEDVGYIYELITRANRVTFVPKIYFLRRIRPQSTMTKGFTAKNIEGYLKSFLKAFELEHLFREETDERFVWAVKKWQRDIFGRLRQLYQLSEEEIYHQAGGFVNEECRRLLEIVKLATPGVGKAHDIIGKVQCEELYEKCFNEEKGYPEIYVCGMGQYAQRTVELLGSLGFVVKGIVVSKKEKAVLWGFPVYEATDVEACEVPVVLAVSRYTKEEYREMLEAAGWKNKIEIRF